MEVASTAENQQLEDPSSSRFTWKIENFTALNDHKHYSEIFIVGGYKWRILIFPAGNNVDFLSMYLDVADSATLPYGWSKYAQFSLAVINQAYINYTIRKDTQHQFNSRESNWGFTSFMPFRDLYDPFIGYLINDTMVIEAEVVVGKVIDHWTSDSKKETGNVGLKNQGATCHIPYPKKVVRFRLLDKPNKDVFGLELSKHHNYDDVVERVARHLGLDDPSKIRLTSHNCFTQQPMPQPIKYRDVEHLSDMLVHYNQMSDVLYYEVLDLKTLKAAFQFATKDKVELSHPNSELRLLEVFYHKSYKDTTSGSRLRRGESSSRNDNNRTFETPSTLVHTGSHDENTSSGTRLMRGESSTRNDNNITFETPSTLVHVDSHDENTSSGTQQAARHSFHTSSQQAAQTDGIWLTDEEGTLIKRRGHTTCKDIQSLPSGIRVHIKVNDVGIPCNIPESILLGSYLGIIAKNAVLAPINFSNWCCKGMTPFKKKMLAKVESKFDIPRHVRSWVLQSIEVKWCNYKSSLKAKYFDSRPVRNIMEEVPKRVDASQWCQLVTQWTQPDYEIQTCELLSAESLTPKDGNIEANERGFSLVMGPENSGRVPTHEFRVTQIKKFSPSTTTIGQSSGRLAVTVATLL